MFNAEILKNKIAKFSAIAILGIMFLIMFGSSWNDSATFDEVAHIPAGYSYLTQKDYRLNPEHPPLAKVIATLPLLLLKNLKFPTNVPAWQEEINGQWSMGRVFLYESGNDADQILHYSRFPIMMLALILGWIIFEWTRKRYGNRVGLLALFFYSFSPTIIAHSRYVTTDTATTLGIFVALAVFTNYLANQTRKKLIITGLCLGMALLFKFSVITITPLFILLAVIWAHLNGEPKLKIIGKTFLIFLTASAVIWGVYQYTVWNYPPELQAKTTELLTGSFRIRPIANLAIWSADKPILRPLGQYLFGLMMMTSRATGGNANYYLGTLYGKGNFSYFPLLYLVKESLAFHVLTLLAIAFYFKRTFELGGWTAIWRSNRFAEWIKENFSLFAGIAFVIMHAFLSITGNLNIGVRHIMPILPFIYIIVAIQTMKWLKYKPTENIENFWNWFKDFFASKLKWILKHTLTAILLLWMFLSTIFAAPYYLSYYNALGGGIENGYKIATDSNYDWGQDMKRLRDFVEENNIQKFALDYFGGGNAKYYFDGKVEGWWSSRGNPKDLPADEAGIGIEWLMISANTQTGAFADTAPGFERSPEETYSWLKGKVPYARAGSSIFIYKF